MKALSRSLLLVAVVLAGWAAPAFAIRGRSSPAAEDAAGLRRTTAGLKVLLFTSEECLWCRRMKTETLTDPRVLGLLQTMPLEEVDVNRQLAVAARYMVNGTPTLLVITPDGRAVVTLTGFLTADDLLARLQPLLARPGEQSPGRDLAGQLDRMEQGQLPPEEWPALLGALGDPDRQKAVHDRMLRLQPFPRAAIVAALTHTNLAVRLGALDLLEEVAGDAFGFDPWDPDNAGNLRARERWQDWAGGTSTQVVAAVYAALTAERTAAYLADLASDNSDRVQRARRMLSAGGPALLEPLTRALTEHPEWPAGVRSRVREIRLAVMLPLENRVARETAAYRLVYGPMDEKLRALTDLVSAGARAVPVLAEFLADESALVRETAADALLQAGGVRALAPIRELLAREKDPEILFVVLRGLGAVRSAGARQILAGYAGHTNEDLAVVALQSLIKNKAADAGEVIGKSLKDPRWRVRAMALEAVGALELKTLQGAVEKRIDDPDTFVRFAAVKALASIGRKNKSVSAKLLARFKQEDELKGVIAAALVSLEATLPREFGGELRNKEPDIVLPVVEALAQDERGGWQLALELTGHANLDVACAALQVVAFRGLTDPEGRAQLVAALRDGPTEKIRAVLTGLRLPRRTADDSAIAVEDLDISGGDLSSPASADGETGGLGDLFAAFAPSNAPAGTAAAPAAATSAPAPAVKLDELFASFSAGATTGTTATVTAQAPTGRAPIPWQAVTDAVVVHLRAGAPADLRTAAALALAALDPVRALPFVQELLPAMDIEQRERLAATLEKAPPAAALPVLKLLLADSSAVVRKAAVSACLEPRRVAGMETVLQELERSGTPLCPAEALQYRMQDVAQKGAPRRAAGAWARHILKEKSAADLQTLALILLDYAWQAGDQALLAPYLKTEAVWQRRAAWYALGHNAREALLARAGELIKDPAPEVREALPALLYAGYDVEWEHRFDAQTRADSSYRSYSSRRVRLKAAEREALNELTADASPLVRFKAFLALLQQYESVNLAALVTTLEQYPERKQAVRAITSYLKENFKRLGQGFSVLLPFYEESDRAEAAYREICVHFKLTADADEVALSVKGRQDAPLAATYLAAPEPPPEATNQTFKVVFFTSPGCAECARVESWWPHIRREFPRLEVEVRNIRQLAALRLNEALCERFGVPDRLRLVAPVVFSGGGYLVKGDVTEARLRDLLTRSGNVPLAEWYPVDAAELERARTHIEQRFAAMSLGVVLLAGLVDGINPCAFATIIFFLSYLQLARRSKREMAQVALAFILGVFLAYFGLGLGFMEVVTRLHLLRRFGQWLNWAMAAFALVIMVLSLRDGVLCLKGRLQDMTLQLPLFLKSGIHAAIRTGARQARFVAAALVVGLVVSVLELACTGQVYGPTILFILGTNTARLPALGCLLLYNLAFVLPLVIIFVLGVYGLRHGALAQWLQRHAAAVKFATAALFLLLFLFFVFGDRLAAAAGALTALLPRS